MTPDLNKEKVSFDFQGITIAGYIISSTDMQPHFHWFLLEDANLIERFGDGIAFKEDNGKLEPVRLLPKHRDFIVEVRKCVEQNILKEK